jgi:hypothetical protein
VDIVKPNQNTLTSEVLTNSGQTEGSKLRQSVKEPTDGRVCGTDGQWTDSRRQKCAYGH